MPSSDIHYLIHYNDSTISLQREEVVKIQTSSKVPMSSYFVMNSDLPFSKFYCSVSLWATILFGGNYFICL